MITGIVQLRLDPSIHAQVARQIRRLGTRQITVEQAERLGKPTREASFEIRVTGQNREAFDRFQKQVKQTVGKSAFTRASCSN